MKLPPEFDPIIMWWEKDGKKFALYVLVLLVAVGAYRFLRYRQAQRIVAATEAAVGLENPMEASGEFGGRLEAFEKAAVDFKGTPSEGVIRLRLAKGYYDAGRFEEARALYAELKSNPPEGFAGNVALGEAQALEGVGNDAQKLMMSQRKKGESASAAESETKARTAFEAALKAFDGFAQANTNFFLTLSARLGAARVLGQLDRKDEAVKRLEALKEELKGDGMATSRIEMTLDAVRRFVKREQTTPIDEINGLNRQLTAGAPKPAPAPAAKKPAPAPAPAAKKPAPAKK